MTENANPSRTARPSLSRTRDHRHRDRRRAGQRTRGHDDHDVDQRRQMDHHPAAGEVGEDYEQCRRDQDAGDRERPAKGHYPGRRRVAAPLERDLVQRAPLIPSRDGGDDRALPRAAPGGRDGAQRCRRGLSEPRRGGGRRGAARAGPGHGLPRDRARARRLRDPGRVTGDLGPAGDRRGRLDATPARASRSRCSTRAWTSSTRTSRAARSPAARSSPARPSRTATGTARTASAPPAARPTSSRATGSPRARRSSPARCSATPGSGGDAQILGGIDWAVANGCAVVSMSLGAAVAVGTAYSTVFETAAQRAAAAGHADRRRRGQQRPAPAGQPPRELPVDHGRRRRRLRTSPSPTSPPAA